MTLNTSSLIQESALNRMVQLAFRGQNRDPVLLDSALGVLKKCGLNAEQTAKIAAILGNVPSDNASQAPAEMRKKILAILKKEAVVSFESTCFSEHPIEIIDITEKIFKPCLAGGDITGLLALACASVKLYENFTFIVGRFDLNLCCGLTILDAKTQGTTIDDEPIIDKLAILKCCKELAPCIENNEGLTLLTMNKGLTLNQLVVIAEEKGITLDFGWKRILRELGDVPVEQTYVILITNSVFLESRDKVYALQKELVVGHGCEIPTVQEYVALCVFTNKYFQKCLYGENPTTYGYSFTHVGGNPVVVGNFAQARLVVFFSDYVGYENVGAGGRRKI